MELPHLGKHCMEKSCHQLDFLPMKCDACELIYCKDHVRYDLHHCESSYKKDLQVPVCPLCSQPVPWKRGDPPDLAVGDHIDRLCQSDPAVQKRKVFGNRCTVKGCKQKEVIPVICNQCNLNHCLKHRHPNDHGCKQLNPSDRAREAAIARASTSGASSSSNTTSSKVGAQSKASSAIMKNFTSRQQPQPQRSSFSAASLQGNLNEDEALARALQASLQEQQQGSQSSVAQQQEEADRMLALALQQSEQQTVSPTTSLRSNSNSCTLS